MRQREAMDPEYRDLLIGLGVAVLLGAWVFRAERSVRRSVREDQERDRRERERDREMNRPPVPPARLPAEARGHGETAASDVNKASE